MLHRRIASFLLASALLLPVSALAQSGAGAIQGTVQDLTDAALPMARVQVVNTKTNVTANTTSNETGFYAVQGLFAGTYTISFSSPGMKNFETTVNLQNSQVVVLNPKLTVGDVSERVTVAADTVQLPLAPSLMPIASTNSRKTAATSLVSPRRPSPAWKPTARAPTASWAKPSNIRRTARP